MGDAGIKALVEATRLAESDEMFDVGRRELATAALLTDAAKLTPEKVEFVMNAMADAGLTEGVVELVGGRFTFTATQVQGEGWIDADGLQHLPDLNVDARRLGTAYKLGLAPDKVGIGAGVLSRKIVDTIKEHPEIGYALTAIDILSGPVTFIVGEAIETSPVGRFAEEKIGQVREFFADRFEAVQYDAAQSRDGGTGTVTLGILGLGIGASRSLQMLRRMAISRKLGVEGEYAVGLTGPKERVQIPGLRRYRYPDRIDHTTGVVTEVKNVRYQSYTRQIRDYVSYASAKGYTFELYVRGRSHPLGQTRLSSQLEDAVSRGDIDLIPIPGTE